LALRGASLRAAFPRFGMLALARSTKPRILARMRPVRLAALALALALPNGGCGDDQAAEGGSSRQVVARAEPSIGARVETFVAAPDYDTLVSLLAQGHAVAREQFGPHRLRYNASFKTGSANIDAAQPLPDVTVDQPIYERFAVTDVLELLWGSQPGEAPKLVLDQHNEHEHGRALVLIEDREWANLDGRGWFERPLESDLWQLWLDDAQHAVLDLVELAGPHADIASVALEDLDGRPAVRVSLRQSDQRHPERTADGPTPWRRDAEVQVISATIVLDRATGLWRRASIELSWSFRDSAHRDLRGHALFEGSVDPLGEAPAIVPPADAKPVPERDRPELMRERLLDGLAGP
jgi:hypothetical protein